MSIAKKTLRELAEKIGAKIKGDPECKITGIAPIQAAIEGQLSFLSSPQYQNYLPSTGASAVIVSKDCSDVCKANLLIVKDPYYAYSILAREFESVKRLPRGIHQTAVIGENCHIDPSASLGAYVVLGDNVSIGANTQIYSGCVVGEGCTIGADCILRANVTLYEKIVLHDRVIIHSASVIGADGFGYAPHGGSWNKIPQLGSVVLEEDVEIGASTTIDRGALGDTVIGKRVKIDNQVQIGHNVKVGEDTIMAGCSGVAGSTTIGKHCILGVNAGVGGHLTIADHVVLGGRAMVTNSIKEPGGVYASGVGHDKIQNWKKNVARFRHLDEFVRRLMALEKKVNKE